MEFSELQGKILTKIENRDNKQIIFTVDNDEQYKLYHDQDCCESVMVEDIVGDLSDLVGSPIQMAEEVAYEQNKIPKGLKASGSYDDSFSWTFYKLATIKGYVTIRWLGESNGYYSESVDFKKI